MNAKRVILILLVIAGPLIAAVIALPFVELRFAQLALDARLAEHPAVTAAPLARGPDRTLIIDHIVASTSRGNMRCDAIRLHPDRRGLVQGGRPLQHVHIAQCDVSTVPSPDSGAASRAELVEARSRSAESRVREMLDSIARATASLEIDSITLDGGSPLRTFSLGDMRLSAPTQESESVTIDVRLEDSHPLLQASVPLEVRADSSLNLAPGDRFHLGLGDEHVSLGIESIALDGDALAVDQMDLSARDEDASIIAVERITVQRNATRPLVQARGLRLDAASLGDFRELAASISAVGDHVEAGRVPDAGGPRADAEPDDTERVGDGAATAAADDTDTLDLDAENALIDAPEPRGAEDEDELDAVPAPEDAEPTSAPLTRAERLAARAEEARSIRERIHSGLAMAESFIRSLPEELEAVDPARLPVDLRLDDITLLVGERDVRIEELRFDPDGGMSLTALIDDEPLHLRLLENSNRVIRAETPGWPLRGLATPLQDGRASGVVDVVVDESGVRAVAEGLLRELTISHEAISPEIVGPFEIGVEVELLLADDGSIDAQLRLRMGEVRARIRFEADGFEEGSRLRVSGDLGDGAACADLWRWLPAGLTPNLASERLRWEGMLRPTFSITYELGVPYSLRLQASAPDSTCRVVSLSRRLDPEQLNSDTWIHHVVEGTEREDIFVGPGTDSWVPIETLPSYVPALMYLSEEMAFFRNSWISIPLLNRALRMNIERGYYVYGGSTVTQQLVKNLFLTRDKTISRKIEEAVLVWALEERVSKVRVLELYLNCIEFGPDIWGIRRAARWYFDKEPQDLTPLEAAFLAALKPSPRIGGPWRERGHTPDRGWFRDRLELLLERTVSNGGHIESDEVASYAPFVVVFPEPPEHREDERLRQRRAEEIPWRRMPRPEGARTWLFNPDDPEHLHGERIAADWDPSNKLDSENEATDSWSDEPSPWPSAPDATDDHRAAPGEGRGSSEAESRERNASTPPSRERREDIVLPGPPIRR